MTGMDIDRYLRAMKAASNWGAAYYNRVGTELA
jgi:hypothetical protein